MPQRLKKRIPNSRIGRIIVGVLLCIGGILGFLPVLGFWMFPLGLFVLSVDFPVVRRFRRSMGVKIGRWWTQYKQKKAEDYAKRGLYKKRED